MKTENGATTSLEIVRAVVDRLRARHAEIARAIYARIREVVPDSAGARDPAYQAGVLTAIDAVLGYSFDAIEHGPGWSRPIPDEAVAQARRAARVGVSSSAVVRRYVAGHRRLGDVAEETVRTGFARSESAVHEIRRTLDELLERFTAVIEREHDRERERIVGSPEQRRLELVRSLLDGEAVAQAELDGLRYKFNVWHVGVIVTGANARAVLARLKADRQLLQVPDGEEALWGWLGAQRRPASADMERIRLDREAVDVSLGVGEPARGIEGWRQTHHQAQTALQVALIGSQGRARYADIAVLIPWLEDPDRGRALIELYLSPLDSQKDRGAASRQTLRAYLEAGWHVSSAARKLGIDRRTLSYRLDTIGECLGYKLDTRRAELELALRLCDLLRTPDNVQPGKNFMPQLSHIGVAPARATCYR